MSAADEPAPPPGFLRIPEGRVGGFNALTGPWYVRDEGGQAVFGFRVLPKHTNPAGTCHGGMLATFCDVMLPVAAAYRADPPLPFVPTVSLSLDFLAPTRGGAWVEGRAQVLRRGRRMLFVQGLVTADAVPVVRASGTFSIVADPEGINPTANLLRVLLERGASG